MADLADETTAKLIARLVEIRKDRGMKARHVARRLHVSPTSVSLFENAVNYGRSPTIGRILRYAQVVGAEIHVTATQARPL